jgi:hypothetical protein
MAMKPQCLVPIENTNLVRDMSTKAVLNSDVEGQSRYRSLYNRRLQEIKENVDTKKRLQDIESELASIKLLMTELSTLTRHPKIV